MICYVTRCVRVRNNDFFVQMSLAAPPRPFVNANGGDEWRFACLKKGEDPSFLKKYVDEFENKKSITLSTTSCKPDRVWMDYVGSDQAKELWKGFSESILGESYYEEQEDDERFERWYGDICSSLWQDIVLFSEVEVLRIQGLTIPDFKIFANMPDLRVLELVGTSFSSDAGIDCLYGLEQLCCFMD